jgi:hypothetical protein
MLINISYHTTSHHIISYHRGYLHYVRCFFLTCDAADVVKHGKTTAVMTADILLKHENDTQMQDSEAFARNYISNRVADSKRIVAQGRHTKFLPGTSIKQVWRNNVTLAAQTSKL